MSVAVTQIEQLRDESLTAAASGEHSASGVAYFTHRAALLEEVLTALRSEPEGEALETIARLHDEAQAAAESGYHSAGGTAFFTHRAAGLAEALDWLRDELEPSAPAIGAPGLDL